MLPLDGIKVLDLTKFIAGPICTQYLGAMGAEIVKIEDPSGGDGTRAMPPFVGDDGATFLAMNCNKRSVAVDLKSDAGRAVVAKLAAWADVVVESFGPGVADRLGVGQKALSALNPGLVYCCVSGFGRGGPLGDQPGYEVMMQAFSGLMSVTGEPDGGPLRIAFSPLDQTTGLHALSGILAALRLRDRTGRGGLVEVSLFETALGLLGWHAQSYWIDGKPPERVGSRHASLVPYGAFKAQDGDILIAVGSENLWAKFCDSTGLDAMRTDTRFRTNADRVANTAETIRLISERIATRTIAEWSATFAAHRVPSAPVNALPAVLSHPQTEARGIVSGYRHPVGGEMRAVVHPVTFDGAERHVHRAPPRLGEHTAEVLAELGYAPETIAELGRQCVIQIASQPSTTTNKG